MSARPTTNGLALKSNTTVLNNTTNTTTTGKPSHPECCTPKNALFCCHSPIISAHSPKAHTPIIMPVDAACPASSASTPLPPATAAKSSSAVPVRIPDLRALGMVDVSRARLVYRTESFEESAGPAAAAAASSPTPSTSAESTSSSAESSISGDRDDTELQQPVPQPLPRPKPTQQPPPPPPPIPNTTAAATATDNRMGVILRRATPPRRPLPVKQPDPIASVVLRKVVKQTGRLGPPPVQRPKGSPPPAKQRPAGASAAAKTALPIASTSLAPTPLPRVLPPIPALPAPPALPAKPPVNLLLTQKPVEVLRIEGDKIIIIKRIPRRKPPTAEEVARARAEADAAAQAAAVAAEKARIRSEKVHAAAREIVRQRRAAAEAARIAAGGDPRRKPRPAVRPAAVPQPVHSKEPVNKEPFCLVRQKVVLCVLVFVHLIECACVTQCMFPSLPPIPRVPQIKFIRIRPLNISTGSQAYN